MRIQYFVLQDARLLFFTQRFSQVSQQGTETQGVSEAEKKEKKKKNAAITLSALISSTLPACHWNVLPTVHHSALGMLTAKIYFSTAPIYLLKNLNLNTVETAHSEIV